MELKDFYHLWNTYWNFATLSLTRKTSSASVISSMINQIVHIFKDGACIENSYDEKWFAVLYNFFLIIFQRSLAQRTTFFKTDADSWGNVEILVLAAKTNTIDTSSSPVENTTRTDMWKP